MHTILLVFWLFVSVSSEDSKQCWCNSQHPGWPCKPDAQWTPPPASGKCVNLAGCVQEVKPGKQGSRYYCATKSAVNTSEYSIVNGQLHHLLHVCRAHLCLAEFLPSLQRCPWRMSATHPSGMSQLQCACNNSSLCKAGTCNFDTQPVASGMFPACRYWKHEAWKEPIVDCWLNNRADDRHFYQDDQTTYLICRDGNMCNSQDEITRMAELNIHCPKFLADFEPQDFTTTTPKMTPTTTKTTTHEIRHSKTSPTARKSQLNESKTIEIDNSSDISTKVKTSAAPTKETVATHDQNYEEKSKQSAMETENANKQTTDSKLAPKPPKTESTKVNAVYEKPPKPASTKSRNENTKPPPTDKGTKSKKTGDTNEGAKNVPFYSLLVLMLVRCFMMIVVFV